MRKPSNAWCKVLWFAGLLMCVGGLFWGSPGFALTGLGIGFLGMALMHP